MLTVKVVRKEANYDDTKGVTEKTMVVRGL